MAVFRHPKTHNERKADQAMHRSDDDESGSVKGRTRTGKKGAGLPTERDDKTPASRSDRSRGKTTRSAMRKTKEKTKDKAFE